MVPARRQGSPIVEIGHIPECMRRMLRSPPNTRAALAAISTRSSATPSQSSARQSHRLPQLWLRSPRNRGQRFSLAVVDGRLARGLQRWSDLHRLPQALAMPKRYTPQSCSGRSATSAASYGPAASGSAWTAIIMTHAVCSVPRIKMMPAGTLVSCISLWATPPSRSRRAPL